MDENVSMISVADGRRLRGDAIASNSGALVGIVFAGLIVIAFLVALWCKYYESLRKMCKKSTTAKKKKDARDFKATEVIVKTLDKIPTVSAVVGSDSTTASVVTAPANDFGGGSQANEGLDLSDCSWTTLGNGLFSIEKDADYPLVTNSHTPRSARHDGVVVPVDFRV